MIKKILSIYMTQGINGVFSRVINRSVYEFSIIRNRLFARKAKCFPVCRKIISNRVGLELGGPSRIFGSKGLLPVYPLIKRLDNCNFSDKTIWEGEIREGMFFQYDKKHAPGRQFIYDATDLQAIPSETYELILASHILEHIANPLKALFEWKRVLKDEGYFLLVLPHKEGTFDHKRPVTSLEHLVNDFDQGTNEGDKSHLQEILELHDLEKDPTVENHEGLKKRSEQNPENRSLHHHVFDTALVCLLLNHVNLQLHVVEGILPYHIVAIAQKLSVGRLANNQLFIGSTAEIRHKTPFHSDRIFSADHST